MNLKTLKNVGKLYESYKKHHEETVSDFIKKANSTLTGTELDLFLEMVKHEQLLEDLSRCFIEKPLLSRIDKTHAETAIFLIIFTLNEQNWRLLIDFFLHVKCFYLCDLLVNMTNPDNHLKLCQVSSKYFEDSYVLDRIVDPFLNKIDVMVALGERYLQIHEVKASPVTKVVAFKGLDDYGRRGRLKPPANTPKIKGRFRASEVPETLWQPSRGVEKALERSKQANKQRARDLLAQANSVPSRLTSVPHITATNEPAPEKFKSKPPPQLKNIAIKSNLTATLREASRVLKLQDEEARNVAELIRGGFDKGDLEELQEQLKREQELQELESIQKNHLKGLLSYEEAILAKKQLLERNKVKMEEYKEERLELLQSLEEWRREEQEKIKNLVMKSQAIKQGARSSELKLLEKKQQNVKEQQERSKELRDKALAEKNSELKKKIELIQEIRAIHRVRFNLKEFDPTESSNLGLLCEMSIAELQERLAITKMNMRKELEEKRLGILRRKKEHQEMIDNVRRIIEESHHQKKGTEKMKREASEEVKMTESPSLAELRKCLEEKRRLRIEFM